MDAANALDPAKDSAAERKCRVALFVLLAALACVWLPSVSCGFVKWDDPLFCAANPDVAEPNFARIFDPTNWVVGDWTPLATVTYAAERALFGSTPTVPHATNVLLHLVAVVLVFKLLREIGFGPWESLGVALVYGVHPLQVESVTWVSARKNVLVAVASLSFFRAYVAGHHVRATVWLVLALCSKATAVGLPVVAAAAQFLGVGVPRTRATWAWILGWTLLAAERASISLSAQATALAEIANLGLAGRMAYMGSVLTTQAAQVVAPHGLSILYEPPRREWSDPVLLAQWTAIAVLVVVCALAARRDRRLAFVGVLAVMMLAPTLNIVPGPCLQADRYAHLPLIGIAAFLVAATRPLGRVHRWAPAALLLVWTSAVLVPATLDRQAVWRTTESLFDDACVKTPQSGIAWSNLGAELVDQGRRDDARLALERALTLPHPKRHTILTSLANLAHDEGDLRRSAALAEEALAAGPDNGRAHALYGRILCETGRVAEAGPHLDTALRIEPRWAPVRQYRAEWRVRTGELDAAREEVAAARALPDGAPRVASVAAAIEVLSGRTDAALATLREFAPAGTSDAALRAALAQKLRYLGRDADAASIQSR